MVHHLLRCEQETIVTTDAETKIASVYTADPVYIRKLDALVKKFPDTYKVVKEDELSKTYEFPKKLLSFRQPRVLTEEQKAECRARLEAVRKN